jgi:hypothetical protein
MGIVLRQSGNYNNLNILLKRISFEILQVHDLNIQVKKVEILN